MVGPLRGGGGKSPEQPRTLCSINFKKLTKPHEPSLGRGGTLTLVVQTLKKHLNRNNQKGYKWLFCGNNQLVTLVNLKALKS